MDIQRHLKVPVICSAACLCFLAACDESSHPLAEEPAPDLRVTESRGMALGNKPLTVMSRNIYLGADIAPLLAVGFDNLEDLAFVAANAWDEVEANDFQERAVALVDEIEKARPDVIGLQELAVFLTLDWNPSTGTFDLAGVLDFKAILENELEARRLPYSFVAVQENTTVTVPVAGVGSWPAFMPTRLVQLTIRDAVLVRRGLHVRSVTQGNYKAVMSLGLDPFGQPIEMKRGWIKVDTKVNGVPYHFVSTHMEVQPFWPVQEMQAQELLNEVVADLGGVTVLMGDFNSNAEGSFGDPSWTTTYGVITDAGFDDAWALANPNGGSDGMTCCQDSDLKNPDSDLDQRIDFVFLRAAGLKGRPGIFPGLVDVEVIGIDPDLRTTPNDLWPSDHAGLVANLGLDRGRFGKFR